MSDKAIEFASKVLKEAYGEELTYAQKKKLSYVPSNAQIIFPRQSGKFIMEKAIMLGLHYDQKLAGKNRNKTMVI